MCDATVPRCQEMQRFLNTLIPIPCEYTTARALNRGETNASLLSYADLFTSFLIYGRGYTYNMWPENLARILQLHMFHHPCHFSSSYLLPYPFYSYNGNCLAFMFSASIAHNSWSWHLTHHLTYTIHQRHFHLPARSLISRIRLYAHDFPDDGNTISFNNDHCSFSSHFHESARNEASPDWRL